MKNIIVKGKPELRKYICQCGHCGCQFHYTEDEVYKNKPTKPTGIINGPIKCVTCPWCLEEIRLPVFDGDINIVPRKQDSDDDMYEVMDDDIDGSHGGLIGPEIMCSINCEDANR